MTIEYQDDFDHVGNADPRVCDECETPIPSASRYYVPDQYGLICQDCREAAEERAWEARQERLMEDGGADDSAYRRDMIDAGRRHLLKP